MSLQELNEFYKEKDPWGYKKNEDDKFRKEVILSFLDHYDRALDIGCGEGWITKDLPANEITGYELSTIAQSRFPKKVSNQKPHGKYDLVVATGVLYKQYRHEHLRDMIRQHASRHILIAGIDDWLVDYDFGKVIKETAFPYHSNGNDYRQRVTLYEVST